MANNLALAVMANLAEKHGYERQTQPGGHGAVHTVAHLHGAEEALLCKAMAGGLARPAPQVDARTANGPAGTAPGMLSLDELAKKKRR